MRSIHNKTQTEPLGTHIAYTLNLDYSTHKAIQLGVKRVPLSVPPSPPGVLFKPAMEGRVAQNDGIPVEVGEESLGKLCEELASCKTILWCGKSLR